MTTDQTTDAAAPEPERFNYFRACLGESYTPTHYGSIEGHHPQRVREAMAELAGTKAADVIAALVHSRAMNDNVLEMQGETLQRLRAELERANARATMFCSSLENAYMAMQAAVLEGKLTSPENGLQWILNTLDGPGLLPDLAEAQALGSAQAWFDKQSAELEAQKAKAAQQPAKEAA